MIKAKELASVSSEEIQAQPVTGKGVVDQNNISYVATLLTLVGDKLAKKTKFVITYLAAKQVGIKVVFLKGNRKVSHNQLETLWKSAKDKKMFEETCHVVPLRPILEKFKDIEAYDLEGNQITLESPDVDFCLVVYDGQHRITVCELHPGEIDVELELNDFNGTNPIESIKMMNSFSRNWNSNDLRTSNVEAGLTENKLYEESDKLSNLYGISLKVADYILTFQREATKRKDLVEGKDTTIYNEENGMRGYSIFSSVMMRFKGAKEFKRIEFMDAVVYSYNNLADRDKATFARNMKLFIATLTAEECDNLKSLLTQKNYGKLNSAVNEGFIKFNKADHSEEELAKMEEETNKSIDSYINGLQNEIHEKQSKKPLKVGHISEIIQHDLKVAEKAEYEKLDKAKKKAAEAQKKAQEAQAEVQKLENENKANSEIEDAEEINS